MVSKKSGQSPAPLNRARARIGNLHAAMLSILSCHLLHLLLEGRFGRPGKLIMYTFLSIFTDEEMQRIAEKMSGKVDTKSPLSPRSLEIIKSVHFSSDELKKAGIAAGIKIDSE